MLTDPQTEKSSLCIIALEKKSDSNLIDKSRDGWRSDAPSNRQSRHVEDNEERRVWGAIRSVEYDRNGLFARSSSCSVRLKALQGASVAVKGCRALYIHRENIDFRKERSLTMKQQGSVHIYFIQINTHEIQLTKKLLQVCVNEVVDVRLIATVVYGLTGLLYAGSF